MSEVTVKELEDICAEISKLESEIDSVELNLKMMNEELNKQKAVAQRMLEACEKDSYKSSFGTIYTATIESVAVPKGDSKQAFFSYLKEKNLFDEVVTVNSQWLNGYFRKERQEALEKGDLAFTMPGLDVPRVVRSVRFRKS